MRCPDVGKRASGGLIIDPFHGGALLSEHDCRVLLQKHVGSEIAFSKSLLAPATRREIIVRMLLNLKRIYVHMRSFPQARNVTELLVALTPSALSELRDRGLLAYHLNDVTGALRDLQTYLKLSSMSEMDKEAREEHDQIWEHVKTLRRRVAALNCSGSVPLLPVRRPRADGVRDDSPVRRALRDLPPKRRRRARAGAEQAPDIATLQKMAPETVYAAMTNNPIPAHAVDLPDNIKRGFAEFVGGRKLGSVPAGAAKTMPNQCAANSKLADPSAGPAWNGWGVDATNARFQTAKAAGLTAAQVPNLKLKWAFGFPSAASMYGQPTVAAGRIFIGVDTGYVYSIDAKTGCVFWSFQAAAGVRNAINIGPVKGHGSTAFAAYFGDLRGNVYALDAATGTPLWIVSVDPHPLAAVTGAPTFYKGRLYVPLASREEAAGGGPDYPCCTFRGSLVALNADTGKQIWKTYIIPDEPKPTRKNSRGVQLFAPSGAGLWASPTIDESRNAIYLGTGDAYSKPPVPKTTDAVMALDLATGKVKWSVQHTENDAWLVGCEVNNPSENCPTDIGPDYDFGSASMMRTLPDGRTIVVSGQKSGEVFAQDVRDGARCSGRRRWSTSLREARSTSAARPTIRRRTSAREAAASRPWI